MPSTTYNCPDCKNENKLILLGNDYGSFEQKCKKCSSKIEVEIDKKQNVSKVRCYVPPLAHRLTGRPDIESPEPNYAKLCIPFVAATALIEGTVNVNHFKTEWLNNALVHEIAKNIQSIETDEKDPNVMAPQFLEVDLKNGETYRVEIKSIYGHPDNPLSYQENIDKKEIFDIIENSNSEVKNYILSKIQ